MTVIQFETEDIREKPLSERLPQPLFEALFQTTGFASMCWDPKPEGLFDSEAAARAANNLGQLIADALEGV
jgi:hypothetical protein